MVKKPRLEEAIYVSWEESEQGWGTRPDGCSLHISEKQYQSYLKSYWAGMPSKVPHEYSRPAGEPVKVQVSKNLYQQIQKSKRGLILDQSEEQKYAKKGWLVYGKLSGWVAT
jgi:hypothetical protein